MTGLDLDEIISKQEAFFASGATRSYAFRLERLKMLLQGIKIREKEILAALATDLRSDPSESFLCELGLVYRECSHAITYLKRWMKKRGASTPLYLQPARSYYRFEPKGRVLILSPWNYPFQLNLVPLIGAIAAGNVIVLKPSHMAAASAAMLQSLVANLFPPEYCHVVTGSGDMGRALLERRWDHIFFTGSTRVGQSVATAAAKYVTPCTLELGGKSPCIVTATAKVELAAKRIVFGKFLNSGQTCVAPDYILVQEAVHDKLVSSLKREIEKAYTARPLESGQLTRIINGQHLERLRKLADPSKVVLGGQFDVEKRLMAPTLMCEVTMDDAVMNEEIFGPILPIIKYRNLDELGRLIDRNPTPLALYLFSENVIERDKITSGIRFGGGCINDTVVHIANDALPFGGIGSSGHGAYHGIRSFHCFSHAKGLVEMSTKIDLPIRYAPRSALRQWIVRVLMKHFV